jgi:hypothetical protein
MPRLPFIRRSTEALVQRNASARVAEQLERQSDLTVGVINHPQSNLADFYREMGELFGVPAREEDRPFRPPSRLCERTQPTRQFPLLDGRGMRLSLNVLRTVCGSRGIYSA